MVTDVRSTGCSLTMASAYEMSDSHAAHYLCVRSTKSQTSCTVSRLPRSSPLFSPGAGEADRMVALPSLPSRATPSVADLSP